jgi:predicted alpha-1,2-mannosidase
VIAALLLACREAEPEPPAGSWPDYDPLDWVDPTIATGGQGAQVTGLNPGAAWPLGQVLVGPDTRSSVFGQPSFMHYGGYHADDDRIEGFSHTHGSGMGIVDYGAVHVMPRASRSAAHETAEGRAAAFRDEQATAGRYAVTLDDGTAIDIVASPHGAHHRWTFPAGAEPVAWFDIRHALPGVEIGDESTVAIAPDGTVTGYQRVSGGYSGRFGGIRTWFTGRLEPAPVAVETWEGDGSGGSLAVFAPGTPSIELRLAISVVDADGARANLDAELGGGDFDAHLDAARGAWGDWLGRAKVWGGPDEPALRRTFHTAHYRTGLMPRTYADVDGRYRGLDGEVHEADFRYLSDLSLWDTYRTTHPWYALVHPDAQQDAAASLVRMAEDGGSLPRWPMAHGYTGGMIGSPASIVLAETALKGLTDGWDPEVALDYVVAQSDGPTEPVGRSHVEEWLATGWVPGEHGGSVSLTIEYAWADAAGAAFAERLGRADAAERLRERAGSWAGVFDPAVGFAHARAADGTFLPFESPFVWADEYVEGNAWHYLWQAPHDVAGMIEVHHGGDAAAFTERYARYWDDVRAEPDDLLPDDFYWHGNEPVMHYAWLGSLSGSPELSVDAVDWVATHRYDDTTEGLDGNDDAGTLSAWFLWATLGVYPIAGSERYAVAAPGASHVEVETSGGLLVIDAPGADAGRAAPSEVTVDGEPLPDATLTHEQLLGTTLRFAD